MSNKILIKKISQVEDIYGSKCLPWCLGCEKDIPENQYYWEVEFAGEYSCVHGFCEKCAKEMKECLNES